jgi:two-component system LytT family response regulator
VTDNDDSDGGDARLAVLVADDEATARKRLVRLLGAMPDVVVAGECADAHELLARVRGDGGAAAVDVVLLDIQMPELSGIDALSLFPPDGPTVVFCTAHSAHAVAAFDVGAADYLMKPIEAARLRKALDRARQHRRARGGNGGTSAGNAGSLPRLALPTRQGIVLIDPAEVSHAELAGELVTVHAAGREYLSALSLQELEKRLPADRFTRVHRRALVNLAQVARLEPTDTGGFIARTHAGAAIEVSRQAARELRRRLGLR